MSKVNLFGSEIYKCKDWRIIQAAQLNPIDIPVKAITDGFKENPKKNPKY